MDVRQASSQLVNAESVIEALSEASTNHQAESLKPGYDSLKAFTNATQQSMAGDASGAGRTAGGGTGTANGFAEPIMLMASPSGIALSTQQSTQIAADQHVNVVSGGSTHIASGKSLIASIGEKLSLFVQNAGMKLFAAKGKVEVQAHSDGIELTAQKGVKVISITEAVKLAAQREILLTSGGAYIRIKDGNIELHAPGTIDVKGAKRLFNGPKRMDVNHPAFKDMPTKRLTLRTAASPASISGVPAGMPYKLFADGALIKQGVIDATGQLPIDHHAATKAYKLEFVNGVTHTIPVPGDYRGDAANGGTANRGFQFHESSTAKDVTPPGDRALHRRRYDDLLDPERGD
jgi:type VI secretion system secreted protein VgrG